MGQIKTPRIQRMERPRESAQFTGLESVDDVSQFVRKYRPRAGSAFSPVMRTLDFTDDEGGELNLKLNDLVVYMHGDLRVMPSALFLPAPDTTEDNDE